MYATVIVALLAVASADESSVESFLASASHAFDPAATHEQRQAAFDAKEQLVALATEANDAAWYTLRARLLQGLEDENLGVWDASVHALAARDPEMVAALLTQQLAQGRGADHGAIIAGALAQIGGRLTPQTQASVAAALFGVLSDHTRPAGCSAVTLAIGNMGAAGVEYLQRIEADKHLRKIVISALPYAYSQTSDERAFAPLSDLLASSASDGERVACLLAMGTLVRAVGQASEAAQATLQTVRSRLLSRDSNVVSAAAAVALARAGELQDESEVSRVFELFDDASSRKNALRAILQSGLALDANRLVEIVALAEDPDAPLGIRKIAMAILAAQESSTSTADQGE
jgi:hypothetical protein